MSAWSRRVTYLTPSGNNIPSNIVLGNGRCGLVLRQGIHVLKVPKVEDTSNLTAELLEDREYVNNDNRQTLEKEKAIYRRLQGCYGVASVVEISKDGILLEYYPHGDLEGYVRKCKEPTMDTKASWIRSVTRTIHDIHKMKVLVDDIALRNFLVAAGGSLKIIDFGEGALFQENTDMAKADDQGATVHSDIFHVGCLIYSLAGWTKFECNLLHHEYSWPPINELPSLDGVPFSSVIEKCWTRQYQSSGELHNDVCRLVDL